MHATHDPSSEIDRNDHALDHNLELHPKCLLRLLTHDLCPHYHIYPQNYGGKLSEKLQKLPNYLM